MVGIRVQGGNQRGCGCLGRSAGRGILRIGGDQNMPGVPSLRAAQALAVGGEPAAAGRLVGRRHGDLGGDERGNGRLLRRDVMALPRRFGDQQLADHQRLGGIVPGLVLRRRGVVLHLGGDRRRLDDVVVDADHRISPAMGRAAPRRRTSW